MATQRAKRTVETPHQIWTKDDAKTTPASPTFVVEPINDTHPCADDYDPRFMFSMIKTGLLVAAVRGEIDVQDLVKKELANRGLDWSGKWIGFAEAKSLAKCFPVRINGKLRAISVPDSE